MSAPQTPRRALQALAKEHGVKANMTSAAILAELDALNVDVSAGGSRSSSTTMSSADHPCAVLNTLATEQSERYREKGFGLIVSALIWASFFYGVPQLVRKVWPWVLSLGDEFTLYWVGTAVVNIGIFAFINTIMLFIYTSKVEFFERYRIQRNKPWQWDSPNPRTVARWKELRTKALLMLAFNNFIMGPMLGYFGWDHAHAAGMSFALDAFPEWHTVTLQIFLFMLIDDTMFYWGHRLLHWKPLYPYIHKVHHSFYQPVGIASLYSHPIEILVTNMVPFMAGPFLVGAHVATLWIWLVLRIAETCDGHSGYEFSWSPYRLLPFSGSAAHHDFHHSHNKGNFGSFFTVWDKLCSTDRWYEAYVEEGRHSPAPDHFFVAWIKRAVGYGGKAKAL